ncbi:MAG: 2-oxo acid dehydrogenase subunit E2 [Candidatus Thorarchaeota archaeon]|nr:2-oxo acid dehydrogenase subunit E2 [Candidatus Thorarchaeota archaeon]
MVTTMIMQRMSVAMEYGVILKWLKKEGDKVKAGDPVVEIFGEKNEFELEAPADGVILKILADVDDEIPISEPIAYIGEPGEKIPDARPRKLNPSKATEASAAPTTTTQTAQEPTAATSKAEPVTTTVPSTGRIKASPRAKKRAQELGVDLRYVRGTGPDGRIVEKDVVAAAESSPTPAAVPAIDAADERTIAGVETLTPLRKMIARRMTQSAQNPHITMITEIDMTEVVALREEINERTTRELGIRVSFNDIIIKAVADVLERFPRFNATLVGDELRLFKDINIGVAVATDNGLIVPVVKAANKKSISQIAQETKALGRKAREGSLDAGDLSGGTFTISNLGSFGVDLFIPVINPPESAILALGQIKKKPVVVDDEIVIRHMMMASCAVDHRILDGAPAGQFLAALKDTLENPFFLKI